MILLTGAFEPLDEERARQVGCDGVLVKPFEPQMVINRVKELLAGPPSGDAGGDRARQPPRRATASSTGSTRRWRHRRRRPQRREPATPLEDYFDRLDAAFANIGAPPGASRGRASRHEDLSAGIAELHQPPPQATPAGQDPMTTLGSRI